MKIEILFKEFCNLYGDIGNINYLDKTVKYLNEKYNINSEIIYTGINEEIKFLNKENNIDLVYIGSLSETKYDLVINKLNSVKDKIINRIKDNQIIIATGNSLDIFSKYIVLDKRYIDKNFVTTSSNKTTLEYLNVTNKNDISNLKQEEIDINNLILKLNKEENKKYLKEGLGLFNTITITNMLLRYNSNVLADFNFNNSKNDDNNNINNIDNIKLVGFKNSFTQTYYISEEILKENNINTDYIIKSDNFNDFNLLNSNYFAKVLRGSGNSKHDINEGIRINNFFLTYIVGPLFILNPDFTNYILNLAINNSNCINEALKEDLKTNKLIPYLYEDLKAAYEIRLNEFKDSKKDLGEFK